MQITDLHVCTKHLSVLRETWAPLGPPQRPLKLLGQKVMSSGRNAVLKPPLFTFSATERSALAPTSVKRKKIPRGFCFYSKAIPSLTKVVHQSEAGNASFRKPAGPLPQTSGSRPGHFRGLPEAGRATSANSRKPAGPLPLTEGSARTPCFRTAGKPVFYLVLQHCLTVN